MPLTTEIGLQDHLPYVVIDDESYTQQEIVYFALNVGAYTASQLNETRFHVRFWNSRPVFMTALQIQTALDGKPRPEAAVQVTMPPPDNFSFALEPVPVQASPERSQEEARQTTRALMVTIVRLTEALTAARNLLNAWEFERKERGEADEGVQTFIEQALDGIRTNHTELDKLVFIRGMYEAAAKENEELRAAFLNLQMTLAGCLIAHGGTIEIDRADLERTNLEAPGMMIESEHHPVRHDNLVIRLRFPEG